MTEDEMCDIIHGYEDSERDYYERNIELEAENAKLRELVSLYHYGMTHDASPSDSLAWNIKVDSLCRELGIIEPIYK